MSATVYYDGDCPFCRSYVAYARLKERVGEVRLVDARTAPDKAAEFLARGYDLDKGFIVEEGGRIHYGAEAMAFINAELAPKATGLGLFADHGLLRLAYPFMRGARNLALAALGRGPINARATQPDADAAGDKAG
jgi:predicted DCC family thiol-disulfide oxidoreductase YuxK